MIKAMPDRRSIPAVDQILRDEQAIRLISCYGRSLTIDAIRETLEKIRTRANQDEEIPVLHAILTQVENSLQNWLTPTLAPVINATGVILHTNLGRAPLCQASIAAIQVLTHGYSTLEYDLEKGARGSRSIHAEWLLKKLTGAEDALVVNNNAAAVLLILSSLAHRRRVVISRTQLVEIGGGFRIPEVMAQSGAKLVEVGTTNRVHLSDYEQALKDKTALILRAHHSNYKIVGFTSEPRIEDLVRMAHGNDVYFVDDLGSGALLDTASYGLQHEPMVQESIQAGVDLVCFSGDKLLGGPQAGIIVGKKNLIARLKKHPLARAVRADKLCLAALHATLLHYVKGESETCVPIWQMISQTPDDLKKRALTWKEFVSYGEVVPSLSTVGGGSLPEEVLPTFVLSLEVPRPNQFLALLRKLTPPIIGRVENDRIALDPRTVLNFQEEDLIAGLKAELSRSI
jgi:L-seryl-tRNA(Ser) seleniumtransferase